MSRYHFDPEAHRDALVALLDDIWAQAPLSERALDKLVRRHARTTKRMYSKSELIRGVRRFAPERDWNERELVAHLRMKPIRSPASRRLRF